MSWFDAITSKRVYKDAVPIEAAQKEIIAVARRLADSGEILLSTGNSDEMI